MFLQRPNYAMVGRSHASPDGGGFPGAAHRLAADGYDCNGLLRLQRMSTIARLIAFNTTPVLRPNGA
ncbi:MAG: hypothetical protein RL069_1579 [Planctomycetota bacterium]